MPEKQKPIDSTVEEKKSVSKKVINGKEQGDPGKRLERTRERKKEELLSELEGFFTAHPAIDAALFKTNLEASYLRDPDYTLKRLEELRVASLDYGPLSEEGQGVFNTLLLEGGSFRALRVMKENMTNWSKLDRSFLPDSVKEKVMVWFSDLKRVEFSTSSWGLQDEVGNYLEAYFDPRTGEKTDALWYYATFEPATKSSDLTAEEYPLRPPRLYFSNKGELYEQ